ncbi:MAG TPA: hypothetical protein PLU39_15045 [Armatimonadota bacterium]|nr:hypothetical protein [Armatimonadota bacterium]
MQPQKSPFSWRGALALATLCLLGTILGCGSARRAADSSAAAGGSAVIAITWPETEGRVIPAETKRIVIRVVGESELPHLRKEVVRTPGSTKESVTLEGLPFQSLLFLVEAYGEAAQTPIALGGRTVEIQRGVRASVDITLVENGGKAGEIASKGSAVVLVRDVPPGTSHVSLRVLQNGQVIPNEGEPPSISLSDAKTFTTMPFFLPSLPATALLFQATAFNSAGTAIAQGSRSATIDPLTEALVTVALVTSQPGGGDEPGTSKPPVTTGSAVLNITNIAQGDALVVVDPMPGDPSLLGTAADRSPITVPLQGTFVSDNLPVTRVPVLVGGLEAGPWLFVVTTHTGPTTADPVNRVGTVQGTVQAGALVNLDVPLGAAQTSTPPKPDGEVNVLATNITAAGTEFLLVTAFDSLGRVREAVVPSMAGVTERQVTFSLPGGPYTIVCAAYGGPGFDRAAFDQALSENKTSIPSGALAVGTKTVTVGSGAATDATVELRIQGETGAGSINLAMLNVPLNLRKSDAGYEIVSSVVIRVYSVNTNQELSALRRVMVPPSFGVSEEDEDGESQPSVPGDKTLLDLSAPYHMLKPMRLRIDGVPVGLMRFEVFAMSESGGGGQVMGSGSTIAEIGTGVQPVTVTLLPHGNLEPGTVLPGIDNEPSDENPAPRSRSALEAARRFWLGLRRR